MSVALCDRYDILFDANVIQENPDEIESINKNLSPRIELRPYQTRALSYWTYFCNKDNQDIHQKKLHLLFHMATGSGKTVLMAVLMLELYKRGYHNFLFFVNSTVIIDKTRENFLNPASSKYLFKSEIRINENPVHIKEVDSFIDVSDKVINIRFTTIQGLHHDISEPRENSDTLEDFRDYKVVMISDEAHHLNADTKKTLSPRDKKEKNTWESTVDRIFSQHSENVLLEFTATANLTHPKILDKYREKVIFDYSLKEFREDRYSKEIKVREAHISHSTRMIQSIVLSQYRRKVAETHGIQCKPVILMKSITIRDCCRYVDQFSKLVGGLDGNAILKMRSESRNDPVLSAAFSYIMDERGISAENFAQELKEDFSQGKVLNVGEEKNAKKWQIELNTLEDRTNEIRVVFAVNKLNEGWDVLNLFDIVRLHDKRTNETTVAEAQLIGRGARYFPFRSPDLPDENKVKRKYDRFPDHPLRSLEQLHYHCSHDPEYIQEIKDVLLNNGLVDDSEVVKLRLKEEFKESSLYRKGHVWVNDKIKNMNEDVYQLEDHDVGRHFEYPDIMTGHVIESSALEDEEGAEDDAREEPIYRRLKLSDFGRPVLNFALDSNVFFHFTKLQGYFPHISGIAHFIASSDYLGKVTVGVRGLAEDIDNITPRQKVKIVQHILSEIERSLNRNSVKYLGSREFKPQRIEDRFVDVTLKRKKGEAGLELSKFKLDLSNKRWYAYDKAYGTDQEKYLVQYINNRASELYDKYETFFLVRNEKAVRIFSFGDGQAFEPDFILFLHGKGCSSHTAMQLFIEPKGDHLKEHDSWKEAFLGRIASFGSKSNMVVRGQEYSVHGLPFFNRDKDGQIREDFDEAFNNFLRDS